MPPCKGDAIVSDIMVAIWSAARSVRRNAGWAMPQQHCGMMTHKAVAEQGGHGGVLSAYKKQKTKT